MAVRALLSAVLLILNSGTLGRGVAANGPDVKIGNTKCKIISRILISNPVIFHKKTADKNHLRGLGPCRRTEEKDCGIPGGLVSYGVIGCMAPPPPDHASAADIFARVPGKDAPTLFMSIAQIRLDRARTSGQIDLLISACGAQVAIPTSDGRIRESAASSRFHRISMKIADGTRTAEFSLVGLEAQADSFRIIGSNQGVLITVPFENLGAVNTEKKPSTRDLQTQGVALTAGKFESGSYSPQADHYEVDIEREIVTTTRSTPVTPNPQ